MHTFFLNSQQWILMFFIFRNPFAKTGATLNSVARRNAAWRHRLPCRWKPWRWRTSWWRHRSDETRNGLPRCRPSITLCSIWTRRSSAIITTTTIRRWKTNLRRESGFNFIVNLLNQIVLTFLENDVACSLTQCWTCVFITF